MHYTSRNTIAKLPQGAMTFRYTYSRWKFLKSSLSLRFSTFVKEKEKKKSRKYSGGVWHFCLFSAVDQVLYPFLALLLCVTIVVPIKFVEYTRHKLLQFNYATLSNTSLRRRFRSRSYTFSACKWHAKPGDRVDFNPTTKFNTHLHWTIFHSTGGDVIIARIIR